MRRRKRAAMKGGWETEERQMEDRAVHRESAAAESRGVESEDEGEEGDERREIMQGGRRDEGRCEQEC